MIGQLFLAQIYSYDYFSSVSHIKNTYFVGIVYTDIEN